MPGPADHPGFETWSLWLHTDAATYDVVPIPEIARDCARTWGLYGHNAPTPAEWRARDHGGAHGLYQMMPAATLTLPRLSIVGNACTHCGTIMGQSLACTGCGWVDPLTRAPS